jgi:hypothetical protein
MNERVSEVAQVAELSARISSATYVRAFGMTMLQHG